MSRDVMDLLEDATPDGVAPLDYDQVARRAHRRRIGKRIGALTGAVGIVATALVVVDLPGSGVPIPDVLARPGDLSADSDEPEAMHPGDGPDARVGSWGQAATLPGEPRVDPFTGLLGDGRLVVFGGMDRGIEGRRARMDGTIVDVASGEVTPLPDAPLAPGWVTQVASAEDRVLVVAERGTAVFDVAAETWMRVPERPEPIAHPSIVAWDGRTLLVGAAPDDAPVSLYRWDVGDSAWSRAATAPLRPGRITLLEQAFDGRRLALFSPGDGNGDRAAVYDVATNRWQAIPDELLPDTDAATLGWIDAGLAVVPTQEQPGVVSYPRTDAPAAVADPVVIDLGAGTRTPLPPIPHEIASDHFAAQHDDRAVTGRTTGDPEPIVVATQTGHTAQLPTAAVLLADGTWSPPIEARTITVRGTTAVATTVASAFPNLAPMEAAVLSVDGWVPAAESGIDNRSGAGLVLDEDALLVVGGWSVRPPAHGEEPDGEPSETDEAGPYVIDLHRTVWRLALPR